MAETTTNDRYMEGEGVGYAFNLLPPETVAGIGLKDSGTVVTVDGQDYPLMKGATYEDSRRVDGLLDSYGEKRVSDYIKEPVTLKGEVAQARAASSAISQENADGRLDKNLDERISR